MSRTGNIFTRTAERLLQLQAGQHFDTGFNMLECQPRVYDDPACVAALLVDLQRVFGVPRWEAVWSDDCHWWTHVGTSSDGIMIRVYSDRSRPGPGMEEEQPELEPEQAEVAA